LQRVAGLVLASSFARHPLPTSFAALARLLDLRWIPTSIIVAALMGSAATPRLRARLRQVLATLPRKIIQARAREVLRVDKRGRLRDIKCPMLCLHGRSDRPVSKRRVDEIVAALPGCQLRWLNSSHMLLATHAEAAAGMIEDFCELRDEAKGLDVSRPSFRFLHPPKGWRCYFTIWRTERVRSHHLKFVAHSSSRPGWRHCCFSPLLIPHRGT
jgi:hypothetical protein